MGEVYRARDTRLGRLVAIKLVSGDVATDRSAHERLEREARLTSSLNHPNIVTVHDVGEVDGQPCIVMEFVAGETLHARMEARRLKLKEVIAIGAQVAEGLAAAHGAGVVHRDLKPRNIMITEDGRVKILDFGLGKVTPTTARSDDPTVEIPDLTNSQEVVGTAGYMAPEQVTNGRIDNRTDQFALGAILYEMLTGSRAFRRPSPVQTMAAVVEDEPTPLLELEPMVPHELATIVQRCLEKDAARRYASTLDLARDLEDARGGFTPSPWPTPRLEPAPPPARPRPLPKRVAIAAGLAVAMTALLWLWWPFGPNALDEARRLLYRWDLRSNVDRAVEVLSDAVAEVPGDPLVHSALAEAYVRQYEHTQDASLIDRARAEIAEALNYADVAPAHVVQALIDNAQSRHEDAVAAAARALALNNRSSDAYRETGRAYVFLARYDEAIAELSLAVSLSPEDWAAYHYLGAAYLYASHYEEAAAASRRAVVLAPEFAKAFTNLASAMGALGRRDEAMTLLREVAEQHQNATAYTNLGRFYYEQGQIDDALREYERSVEMPDARAEHWRNLAATCYWAPGRRNRAMEAYAQAARLGEQERRLTGSDHNLTAALADSYAVVGRKDEARAILGELETLDPKHKDVLYTIGSVYEQLGERDKALDWLERAVAAGTPVGNIERSPWLEALRQDDAYRRRFGRN
jgi:serine/threonine-protein kinase